MSVWVQEKCVSKCSVKTCPLSVVSPNVCVCGGGGGGGREYLMVSFLLPYLLRKVL